MVIFLIRKPFKTQTNTKFLIIFLLLLGGWGVLRYAEKNNAEDYFHDRNIKLFPSMDPFNWYAQKEDADEITIFNYNGTWSLEYYDPVQRMEMRDFSSTFGIEGPKISSININVTGEIAIVLLQSI